MKTIGFILVIGIIFSFYNLSNYPFVSVYDQVRDGGLNAQQILDGSIKSIFTYDRYGSHGLIIPAITSLFYRLFQNSVLTFRFPSALAGILDILIVYFILYKFIDKKAAFWSALVLITLPLHLYYARTEFVVIFSTLMSSIILLILAFFFKSKSLRSYSLLGLILGFSFGVYASVKVFAILTLLIITTYSIYKIIVGKNQKHYFTGLILMLIFCIVGFGPMIPATSFEIFFQTRQFPFFKNISLFINNYLKSLLVLFTQPTFSTHYPDFKPILDPILSFFLSVGFMSALFFSKNNFLKIICLYVLLIPLTNSAITDAINSDQRLTPLLPVSVILVGYGLASLLTLIKNKIKNSQIIIPIVSLIMFAYVVSQGFSFFENESATKQYSLPDYLSMHTVYFLKGNKEYQKLNVFCFNVSPKIYPYFQLMHVQEQYQYFVPGKTIAVIPDPSVSENQIVISTVCQKKVDINQADFSLYQPCAIYQKFTCLRQGEQPEIVYQVKPNTVKAPFQNSSDTTIIPPYATIIP